MWICRQAGSLTGRLQAMADRGRADGEAKGLKVVYIQIDKFLNERYLCVLDIVFMSQKSYF